VGTSEKKSLKKSELWELLKKKIGIVGTYSEIM
jgi:hypothetical protein